MSNRWYFILFFILCIILAYFAKVNKQIIFQLIQEHHQQIQFFIANHYLFSVISYLFLYVLIILLMIPLTPLLNIASGFFFGVYQGTFYSIIGVLTGSLFSFFIFRYILHAWTLKRYHTKLKTIEHELNKHPAFYILSLQLFPITPFFMINIIAAASKIPAWKFFLVSCIGVTPFVFIYVFAGKKMTELTSMRDILSPSFILFFIGFSLLALLPILIRPLTKKLKQ